MAQPPTPNVWSDARGAGRHELRVSYQPFYNLSSGRLQGHEALLRERVGLTSSFRSAASSLLSMDTDQLLQLDNWVARTATSQLADWRRNHGMTELILSVNISVPSLMDRAFVTALTQHLHELGIVHDRILFDIPAATLSAAQLDGECMAGINRLRTLGFTFCIDGIDGANARALDPAVWRSVDIAKLRPSVLRTTTQAPAGTADTSDMAQDAVAAVLGAGSHRPDPVRSDERFDTLCESLHDRDLPILVTGVETAEHLHLARSLGCEWAQGYFLGEPTFPTEIPPGATALRA